MSDTFIIRAARTDDLQVLPLAECVVEMQRAGVADVLVQQIESYLEAAPWDSEPPVLLHGDLTHLNMLVTERAGSWRISGLIDWGT